VIVSKLELQKRGATSRIAEITAHRTYVIAEIGQNHQGDPAIARELIRRAAECGADAVKSQKRDLDSLLSDEERARPYDSPHSFGRTYGEHRAALELSAEAHAGLADLAGSFGLDYFCSPWDVVSARALRAVGLPYMKIPSAAVTHEALLAEVAGYRMPVLLSTGMSRLEEVDQAVQSLAACELYVLQCTSAYPCEFPDVHLRVIPALRARYGKVVGFSGHHRGIAADIAAVALGARVLERHFTLDRTWKGSDHAASLEPPGLARLVRDVRAVEAALGSPAKRVLPCELGPRQKLRTAALRRVA